MSRAASEYLPSKTNCRTCGIGKAFVDAALNRDYAVMMGVTLLVGALTIVFNLLVDVLYAWIDPKIRY